MNDRLTVGSLFSGIGGFDLGFERAGMRTSWFCEQDDYCRRVLNRHWPGVPVYPDVTTLTAEDVEPVEVLCGGFPCQDLSLAGKGAGIDGARSGLWSEFARLIGELRPRYVIVENVPALLSRGIWRVLADLAALGYDAEWDCLPASAFGAPHRRDRIWIVAYPDNEGESAFTVDVADSEGQREREPANEAVSVAVGGETWHEPGGSGESAPDGRGTIHDPYGSGYGASPDKVRAGRQTVVGSGWWEVEPDVGRVADGVPARMDRLKCLGNALVPQIAEWIGGRIMTFELGSFVTGDPAPDEVVVKREDLRMALEAASSYDTRLPEGQGTGELQRLRAALDPKGKEDGK